MNAALTQAALEGRVERLLAVRTDANARFFEREAERIARLCHRMAERFAAGGRIVALADAPDARSDARHVAVEFVHPVIVGKRALPALAVGAEQGALRGQVELVADAGDIVIGFGTGAEIMSAVAAARARGCLTLAFAALGAEWEFEPPTDDALVRQELVETLYHVLWELVHVFFEHRGLLAGRDARRVHDSGASSFLYPFLAEQETDLDGVLADVLRSIRAKADEVGALREQTLVENRSQLTAASTALRTAFDAGARLLALGNGGSATDAMDAVADFRACGRPAIDLTEDSGILTAVANDVGVEAIFSRQVIAFGRAGDVLLALSTSGNSGNVIAALREARARGMRTIAMVGYGGGTVASEQLADHVVVTRSQHIPRIQEAQASAYHVLRELVADGPG